MNAAEKARLAKEMERQEAERLKAEKKQNRKRALTRFSAVLFKLLGGLFALATVGTAVAIISMILIENLKLLHMLYPIGIGVLIANAVALVVTLLLNRNKGRSDGGFGICVFLVVMIIILGFILYGSSTMLYS